MRNGLSSSIFRIMKLLQKKGRSTLQAEGKGYHEETLSFLRDLSELTRSSHEKFLSPRLRCILYILGKRHRSQYCSFLGLLYCGSNDEPRYR